MDSQAALELLRTYRPPTTLQDISVSAARLYLVGEQKLSDDAIEALRGELWSHQQDVHRLTDAILGLRAFAQWVLEQHDDETAYDQIFELMKETAPIYEPILQALTAVPQDTAEAVKAALDRFRGVEDDGSSRRAPNFGEAAPAGTVPLKRLKPVAQPPRMPVKKVFSRR
jgi:hypothetical protein